MKTIRSAIPFMLLLVLAPMALCQIQDENRNRTAYRHMCPSLQSAGAATLLQYLNNNKPTTDNAICVTWAIYGVGDEKYEPAIPALIGLLDFRRPDILTTWDGLPGSPYPAEEALEEIGQPALPVILAVMKDLKASSNAQASAVEAWAEIYRHIGNHKRATSQDEPFA